MTSPLSIFIICKNEERIIGKCLEQARKLADELVVVDSGSTDATLEITAMHADKFEHRDWSGFADQKNFALSLCSHKWVMSLDADEVLGDEVIAEIQALKSDDFAGADAFKIARRLYIGEEFIRHGGYYPDLQLRIFKKDQVEFCKKAVHESVEFKDASSKTIAKLNHPLDHYAYTSIEDLEKTFKRYAHLFNTALEPSNRSNLKASLKATYTFLNKYLLRQGFLGGSVGFELAKIHAAYSYAKYKI